MIMIPIFFLNYWEIIILSSDNDRDATELNFRPVMPALMFKANSLVDRKISRLYF